MQPRQGSCSPGRGAAVRRGALLCFGVNRRQARAAIIARYVLMSRSVAEVALRCVVLMGYGARNAGNQKDF